MGTEYNEEQENLAFARKYRPSSLDGYVGNKDNKETIMRYLRSGKLPQTILITGDSGCGKTTIARIIFREYRCDNRDPDNGACGECLSCQLFNEYVQTGVADSVSDVYEIDASESSKRDVDAMLESMDYPSINGGWKLYLIDEAHLLSEAAMGRLLKTIEEPPEYVLIVLSTTDPDRLLPTVKNRCQLKLSVSKPGTGELISHLKNVCDNEGKSYDIAGLRMIVARADNVIRDSLNYLETVINTRGDATSASVSVQFHQVDDKIIYDFYNAYLSEDYVSYIGIIYRIKVELGFKQFITSLVNFTVRGIYILNSVSVDGLSKEEIESMLELFSKFSTREISNILAELKKMTTGSIEANLMSFIYSKNAQSVVSEEVKVSEGNISLSEEGKFRNNNLERIQQSMLDKGKESAGDQMATASFDDIQNMFTLEQVITNT